MNVSLKRLALCLLLCGSTWACGSDAVEQKDNNSPAFNNTSDNNPIECEPPTMLDPISGDCITASDNNSPNNGTPDPLSDGDNDGFLDPQDNCRELANPDQADVDADGVGDACDNCPDVSNVAQEDANDDKIGDACEDGQSYDPTTDTDGDGVPDIEDNCPVSNPAQADADGDRLGDLCDNCPQVANYDQADDDADGEGDACEAQPAGVICSTETSDFELVKPNIYVIVDRSTSMQRTDGTMLDRMQRAKQGMDLIADELYDEIRLGIASYPYRDDPAVAQACGEKTKELLSIGGYNANQIKMSYANLGIEPGGLNCTETDDALNFVLDDLVFADANDPLANSREKAVILITDGGACGCGGQTGAVAAANRLQAAGIPVYAVGFSFGGDTTRLDEIATAGGTDAGAVGSPKYYEASNAQQLVNVIKTIQSEIIECDYTLDPAPQDPNKIWVTVDGVIVGPDAQNGYSYDPQSETLSLNGSSCVDLRQATVNGQTPLKIELGCATMCMPQEEVCDFKDNNCDGDIDEGCEGCGPEVCDGKDNDCDDDIDEGCPTCTITGQSCAESSECCQGVCTEDGVCGAECRPAGVNCLQDSDCCSNACAISSGESVGVCVSG